jgi:hypothetical protein
VKRATGALASHSNLAERRARVDSIRRQFTANNGPGANDSPFPNARTVEYHGIGADPDIVLDYDPATTRLESLLRDWNVGS